MAGIFFASLKRSLEGESFQKHLKTSPPLAFCIFLYPNPQLSKLISVLGIKITSVKRWFSVVLAEREGFEPPVPLGTLVFKTSAFDHSAISPIGKINSLSGRQI